MENEVIGKIKLDYTHYSGEDLYSDGTIEDELLEVAKGSAEVEYQRIIEEKGSWPFLYHLSHIRENIIEWLPISRDAKVLEVGSGCGAITGVLSEKAGSVDCVDLSRKRSLINAYRHEYSENVTIHVGNFSDIEPDLDTDYDLICLIGVFEYGSAYIGGDKPYETFLSILKKHLGKGGKIVIAIENKFGLKYFAGCREDHVGTLFTGIEDYPGVTYARTFTKRGLLEIAEKCGFSRDDCHMYYPYPDYKFMHTLFSDRRLPQEGELKDNLRNFDRDRLQLFDEKLAFENILKEGEFPLFSNSYLLVIGEEPDVTYVRYSNDREISKRIVTEKNESGFYKRALNKETVPHIQAMEENYRLLAKRYEGSRLSICPCTPSDDGTSIYFPEIPGRRLEELMDELVFKEDYEGFKKLFLEFYDRISYGENESVTDKDMIFSNIIVDGDTWTVIDYEWVLKDKSFAKENAFRALYFYLMEDEKRNAFDAGELLLEIGVTEENAAEYRADERAFQERVVKGRHKTLSEIREIIANPVIRPEDIGGKKVSQSGMQIYVDRGQGFSEDTSLYPRMSEGKYTVTISHGAKRLRIDPVSEKCIVNVKGIYWNDQELTVNGKGDFVNGVQISEKVFAFGTDDPGFSLSLKGIKDLAENVLTVEMDIHPLPDEIGSAIPVPEEQPGLLNRLFKH